MNDHFTAPDYAAAAIVTIDTQCDTLDGQPFEVAGTSDILPRMRTVIEAARRAGLPVVHVVRIYRRDGANVDLCRRALVEGGAPLVVEGSAGCQLAPGILPEPGIALDAARLLAGEIQHVGPNETILYKPRWGAFYQTPLDAHLQSLGVSTIVLMGCNFPNCPRASIYEASERDYHIALVEDAVSGLYERGAQEMAGIGVRLVTAQAVIRELETSQNARS